MTYFAHNQKRLPLLLGISLLCCIPLEKISAAFENIESFDFVQNRNDQALGDVIRAANQGDAKAQHTLGVFLCENGQGLPNDYKMASILFKNAAEKGFAPAQYSLGFLYAKGQGVPQDDRQALKWYTKAAKQGFVGAQHTTRHFFGVDHFINLSNKLAIVSMASATE